MSSEMIDGDASAVSNFNDEIRKITMPTTNKMINGIRRVSQDTMTDEGSEQIKIIRTDRRQSSHKKKKKSDGSPSLRLSPNFGAL